MKRMRPPSTERRGKRLRGRSSPSSDAKHGQEYLCEHGFRAGGRQEGPGEADLVVCHLSSVDGFRSAVNRFVGIRRLHYQTGFTHPVAHLWLAANPRTPERLQTVRLQSSRARGRTSARCRSEHRPMTPVPRPVVFEPQTGRTQSLDRSVRSAVRVRGTSRSVRGGVRR